MANTQDHGQRFNATSGNAAGGSAVATQAASSGRVHYVTDVTGSVLSATAYITVTAGNTTYWQDVFGTATFLYIKNFTSPIAISSGSAVSVKVLYGTAGSAYANIAGYTI